MKNCFPFSLHAVFFTRAFPDAPTELQKFKCHHSFVLFERLKLVCFMVVCTYPLYFAVDVFFLRTRQEITNLAILSFLHFLSFFMSAAFLLFYRKGNINFFHSKLRISFIYFYMCFYLIVGATSSLNSQFLTNNIYAYLIILTATAVVFPVHPQKTAVILASIHFCFLAGLFVIEGWKFTAFIDTINSTGAAVIAFVLSFTFYQHKQKDFSNQKQMQENEEMFRRLFDLNPYPLVLARLADNQVLLLNKQAVHYYGEEKLMEQGTSFFFKNPDEQQYIMKALQQKQSFQNYVTTELAFKQKTGWAMINFELVDYFEEACLLIGLMDITEFKKEEEKLFHHAFIDELTGTMNRRKGLALLKEFISSASPIQSFTLCYIDLNNLKLVNDQYGHNAGDQFIITVCRMIEQHLGSGDLLFRMGGDEFIIIFPEQPPEKASQKWDKIQQQFDQKNQSCAFPFILSASHGFFYYHTARQLSLEEMLAAADKEMYKEKMAYKKRAVSIK